MMKYLLISFFFLGLAGTASAQHKKIDSLNQLLTIHPDRDSIRAELLYTLSFFQTRFDPEKAKRQAEEALSISSEIGYKRGIGYAHKGIMLYYFNFDYAKTSEHGFEMLKAFEGSTDFSGWGCAYQLLGVVNAESGNTEKAKMYYLKAKDIFERAGLINDLSLDYNSLGMLSLDLKKYDEALAYLLKAAELQKQVGHKEDFLIYTNIATAYKLKKDYPRSLEYFKHQIPKMNTRYNKNGTASVYMELGDLYLLMGDDQKAEHALKQAVSLGREINHERILFDGYEKLMQLEKKRKHFEQALHYQVLSNQYKDSLFTQQKMKQISELDIRYQTEKKDQIIQTLEQQRQLQLFKQWSFIGGLLILISIVVAMYVFQRAHSKKVNTLLQVQQTLNSKLQESDQMKSAFFANISHELRTPLSLIIAPIEKKLSAPRLNASDRQSFQLIRRNANRLLILINQLLDLSKLEARKMELSIQPGELKKLLTIVTSSFDSLAEARQINFHKEINLSDEFRWYDADKLEKILSNLLSNAIKFTTPAGEVRLVVNSPSESEIHIQVTDTGIGIPDAEKEHVFSPFYQSRHSLAGDHWGTGLGLPMVKELVKLYGGTIRLISKVNEGTSLFLQLPCTREKFPNTAIVSTAKWLSHSTVNHNGDSLDDQTGLSEDDDHLSETTFPESVLIVEDNQDLREYISFLLADEFTTLTAKDGEEGFALATEHLPSVILSDVMMPRLDGMGLTQRLKSDQRTSHIPVVLLTAKADDQSKLEGLQLGADDYLLKPFSVAELKIRVINLIEQRKKLAAKYRASLAVASLPEIARELSLDEKFLERARQIVEDHIADTNFGVEQMASEVHLSRAQLFRKLKSISGLSPNEFINEIRLQKAAELIRLRVDGLTQISYRVGYNEQSYFAKRFKKKFGATPTEYQARFPEKQ